MNFKISVIIPAYNAQEHLEETLDSLIKQTFQNFEVIIVNDGSIDNTPQIINEYCEKYSNFKSFTQPNSGVSKARNKGIDEANGEYIIFLDSDDLFAPKALEKMYKVAFENQAELVIGRVKEFNSYGSKSYSHPKNLSNMQIIDKFEKNILWTFLLGNKLFQRKKIIDKKIKFPNLKYAEDGVFIFRYVYQCSRITGCPYNIIFHRKHDFWEDGSLTQNNNIEYIKDFSKAYDLIYDDASNVLKRYIKEAETPYEKAKATINCYEYLDNLLYRRATILFDEFYRLFWKTDNTSLAMINDNILALKDRIFPESWMNLEKSFKDLFIDDLIHNRSLMAEKPVITIVINPLKQSKEEMLLMLKSIYAQSFPAFEVLVHEKLSDTISTEIFKYENFHLIDPKDVNFKNFVIKIAKGKYIIFLEDYLFLNPITLKAFFNEVNKKDYDLVSSEIRNFHENKPLKYESQELAYSYRNTIKDGRKSVFNYLDLYLSNKFIKVDFLKEIGFEFSNDSAKDVLRLYNNAKFKKVSQKYIFSSKDEKELLNSHKSHDKSIRIKTSFFSLIRKPLYKGIKYRSFLKRLISDKRFNKKIKRQLKNKRFEIFIKMISILPLRNRVFFYSIRADHKLLENNLYVYEGLDTKKVFVSKILPHSAKIKLKMLYYLLTSKVLVTDDYLRYFREIEKRKGQTAIQLWHACGVFKKFGLDHPSNDIKTEINTHSQIDIVLVSSDYVRKYYASAFGLPIDKIKALGVPRTDMFFDEKIQKTMLDELYNKFLILKDKKIILYSPTFREKSVGKIKTFDTQIDWKNLNSSLKDDELFIINKHPLMKEDLLNGENYSKILDLSSASTYSLMLASDMMITDYSSVIFEYSLLNRPMIFYCPDADEYTRDFYLNYPEDLPGIMINDPNELSQEIDSILSNPDYKHSNEYTNNLEHFKIKYMGACDGNSTKRAVKIIKRYMKN